jgi:hypothetical protein
MFPSQALAGSMSHPAISLQHVCRPPYRGFSSGQAMQRSIPASVRTCDMHLPVAVEVPVARSTYWHAVAPPPSSSLPPRRLQVRLFCFVSSPFAGSAMSFASFRDAVTHASNVAHCGVRAPTRTPHPLSLWNAAVHKQANTARAYQLGRICPCWT